jgi:hypothetical protein
MVGKKSTAQHAFQQKPCLYGLPAIVYGCLNGHADAIVECDLRSSVPCSWNIYTTSDRPTTPDQPGCTGFS